MRKALFFTALDRPEYLERTLASWDNVRGMEDWFILARIEPGEHHVLIHRMFCDFFERNGVPFWGTVVNSECLGVLHHPWVGFDSLFNEHHFDYVLRTEDDLIVTEDILEYHAWAAEAYRYDPQIGMITGFKADNRSHAEVHREIGLGSPLLIGTWEDRWNIVISPTWDHDYSTGEGDLRGWDHNLHFRVFPARGLHVIAPNFSKVEHIGVYGAHSNPDVFWSQGPLDTHVPPQHYREVPGP